jgi:hypothetical protein
VTPFFKLHFTPANLYATLHGKPPVNGEMRNVTQHDFIQFSMDMVLIGNFNEDMIKSQKKVFDNAVKFMVYIEKEYDLNDD